MKKSAVFLILSFVLLGFFACQYSIPTAIEVIGNPSAKFAETVDVGKKFEELLKFAIDKDERLTMIPCTNSKTEIITNLIHVELINKEYPKLEDPADFPATFPDADESLADLFDTDTPLENHENLILLDSEKDKKNRLLIQLSELGSLLPEFEFYNGKDAEGNVLTDQEGVYKARLYFSGTEIIRKTKIRIKTIEVEVTIDEDDKEVYHFLPGTDHTEDKQFKDGNSNIEKWKEDGYYDGETCPSDGIEIDIPLTRNDIAISFEVYIPEGETLSLSDFEESYINVELVIWLPLKFIAINDEAALSFPDDYFFSSKDDLFGREEPDSESLVFDIVESLSVDINFHNHPFMGRDLIISNKDISKKDIDIVRKIIESNDALSFTIPEDKMKIINKPENWPFAPNIKIGGFATGEKLFFPKDFHAFEFAFKAKVHYRKDFF